MRILVLVLLLVAICLFLWLDWSSGAAESGPAQPSIDDEVELALAARGHPCEGAQHDLRGERLGRDGLSWRDQSRLSHRDAMRPLRLFEAAASCEREQGRREEAARWEALADEERSGLRERLRLHLLRIDRLLSRRRFADAETKLREVEEILTLAAPSPLAERLEGLRFRLRGELD